MRPGRDANAALQLFGTVGCQNEQDIRIFLQTIHFVQQLVEQHLLARAVHRRPVSGDQIDIFDDDHARLEQPGQRHVLGEQSNLLGRDQQRRVSFEALAR